MWWRRGPSIEDLKWDLLEVLTVPETRS